MIRILYDNAIDRAATLTASTTAGLYAASNLIGDDKSTWWRATGTTATLTATWEVGETLSCAALPFCNGSPTETIRVQLYDATAAGNLLLDTNTLQPGALACPAPSRIPKGFTAAQAASAYAYGGGADARIWFAPTSGVKRMVVTITDTANAQGYIEAAFLVAGAYWSPSHNISDVRPGTVDLTEHYRTAAGSLKSTAGTMHRKVPIDLTQMPPADRATVNRLLTNSKAWPIFLSVFPESADLEQERDFMVYGKRMDDSDFDLPFLDAYSTSIEIESL